MVIEKTMRYCRSILQNVSRSFALTIPLVEKNILAPILVGYLEARIMDSFEDENPGKDITKEKRVENIQKVISVIENPGSLKSKKSMEEIRHVAADFMSNPHYLDLAQNMDKVIAVHRTMDKHAQSSISFWFGKMAKGMEKYLNTRIDTFNQLDEYCYYVGGTVGGLVTDLLIKNTESATTKQISILKAEQNDFGLFLQKINIIRDFREDILKNEKIFWPYNTFQKHNMIPKQALEKKYKQQSMTILKKMIANSKKHVDPVQKYISAVPKDFPGYKQFCIINFLMATETLNKIKDNPDVFYSDSPVKIDKKTATNIIERPLECFEEFSRV